MHRTIRSIFAFAITLFASVAANAQADEICSEVGINPSLDSPFVHVPYVFGTVSLKGFESAGKLPRAAVVFMDGQQTPERLLLNRSGKFCFRRKTNSGTIVVEVDGVEAARRTLSSFGAAQQREDFEILANRPKQIAPPGTVSAKFSYPPNNKTIEFYKKAAEAEAAEDRKQAIEFVKQIVAEDARDFIAWAKLGSLYFGQKAFQEAEEAIRRSLELNVEYTPAWLLVGQMRVAQKRFAAAIEIYKHATELDASSARSFQLLGEAYLLNKQGTLGVEALNQAIKLDPFGMAECHLQMAHLYELAGAKPLAAAEYKQFLAKVPDHPDKKKFEKYIRENP